MLISAIQKFTLLDYPKHTACIVFTPGCNFRCGYCHNKEFVLPELITKIKDSFIPEDTFFSFLERRKGKLEGVVVTGGEPTLLPDLIPFLKDIKKKGFMVKLDTNGSNPAFLQRILEEGYADYIAMDIKTSLPEYKKLMGNRADESKLKHSIEIIKTLAPQYEFRATLIKEIHTPEILHAMAALVSGATQFFLQTFRPQETLNPLFSQFHAFSQTEMQEIVDLFTKSVSQVEIRE